MFGYGSAALEEPQGRRAGTALLRERRWRRDVLPAFAVEGIEESEEIALGFLIEIKGRETSVQVRIGQTTFRVQIQDFRESVVAAVVHVGSAMGEVAQSGRFEFPHVAAFLGEVEEAKVGIGAGHAHAQVGEFFVGEVRPLVAFGAFALLVEEIEAVLLLLGQRRFVSGTVAVVGGVSRYDGTFEGGNSLGNTIVGNGAVTECGGEKRRVSFNAANLLHHAVRGHAHLIGIGEGENHLRFQGGRPAVPELRFPPGAVDEGWRAPGFQLAIHSDGKRCGARKRVGRVVAEGARDHPIGREPPIEEEHLAQFRARR